MEDKMTTAMIAGMGALIGLTVGIGVINMFTPAYAAEPVPDWITQTREEVADEEERAAGIHYSLLVYYEEHPEERDELVPIYGDEEWNWHWYQKHSEAAYFIRNPEVS